MGDGTISHQATAQPGRYAVCVATRQGQHGRGDGGIAVDAARARGCQYPPPRAEPRAAHLLLRRGLDGLALLLGCLIRLIHFLRDRLEAAHKLLQSVEELLWLLGVGFAEEFAHFSEKARGLLELLLEVLLALGRPIVELGKHLGTRPHAQQVTCHHHYRPHPANHMRKSHATTTAHDQHTARRASACAE